MATPTVSVSLDKTAYAVGALMTATVTVADADRKTGTVSFTVTDAEGNTSSPVVTPYLIDPLTVTVTDSLGKTWTKVSDTGTVCVWTATA